MEDAFLPAFADYFGMENEILFCLRSNFADVKKFLPYMATLGKICYVDMIEKESNDYHSNVFFLVLSSQIL